MSVARNQRHNRGHGEGSIYRRTDGRWAAAVSLANGKRKYLYGKSRREVQERLSVALRDLQQGLPLPSGKLTLTQFMQHWLDDAVRSSVAPATHASYRRVIDSYILPALGKLPLDKLTPQRVQSLQSDMRAAGLSPRTIGYARAVLRRALGQATKWNLLARNPVDLVDAPKQERHDPKFLTADDARRLMEAIAGDKLEPLILLTLVTGLRRGEVLSLRWRDVDLEGGIVSVEGQYQKWDGAWQWRSLKTRASRRVLSIPTFVITALRTHKARQNEERLAMGSAWKGESFNLLFCTREGTPMDGPNLTRQFARRLRAAGVSHVPFHGLRHSAATLLLARGLTIGQIQKVLGHSTGKLTSDLYSHHVKEIADRAASEMEALFGAS